MSSGWDYVYSKESRLEKHFREELRKQKEQPPKPVLAIDFGGVINSYRSGWQGATSLPDPPNEGAIEFLLKATERFQVAVYSARFADFSSSHAARQAVRDWLVRYGVPASRITMHDNQKARDNTIWLADKKPRASVTLDDRAYRFEGTFPDLEELASLEPWWKKAT